MFSPKGELELYEWKSPFNGKTPSMESTLLDY